MRRITIKRLLSAGVLVAGAVACTGAAQGISAAVGSEGGSAAPPQAQAQGATRYEVVRTYPHDDSAFTQGLVYHDGFLWEGTGRRGQSSVRQVRIEDGEVVQQVGLPGAFFGEGITILDDRVYQLTWMSGIGFVYDPDGLQVVRQFRQFTEGWGLTHNGSELIMSNGTATIYFIDPATMQPTREIHVLDQGRTIDQINELEYVEGEILANVWHSNEILRISPQTGEVLGRIDLAGILPANDRPLDPEGVLNGIAYDPESGRLFVTGKLWPKLFEIRLLDE